MATTKTMTLDKLPAEMLEQVLSNLTAKELCRAQCVSKFWKDFIERRGKAIVRPCIGREKARLGRQLDEIMNLSHLSIFKFDQVLERYYQYYRGSAMKTADDDIFYTFCHNWLAVSYGLREDTREELIIQLGFIVFNLETNLVNLHDEEKQARAAEVISTKLYQLQNTAAIAELQAMVSRVAFINPTAYGGGLLEQTVMPPFSLTSRAGRSPDRHLLWRQKLCGVFDGVCDWLGLPYLSRHGYFTYCVKTEYAYWLARNAYEREGDKLAALKQAAVLEELFVW